MIVCKVVDLRISGVRSILPFPPPPEALPSILRSIRHDSLIIQHDVRSPDLCNRHSNLLKSTVVCWVPLQKHIDPLLPSTHNSTFQKCPCKNKTPILCSCKAKRHTNHYAKSISQVDCYTEVNYYNGRVIQYDVNYRTRS